MRVIGGTARGRRLVTPMGNRVRPTLDRVREALFNILGPDLSRIRFLDLFAGSGANGIEALSRGATAAVFVDDHAQSLTCVRQNLDSTGVADRGRVLRLNLPRDLRRIPGAFDVIFADPPYDFGAYPALLAGLVEFALLAEGGTVVIEHGGKADVPAGAGSLRLSRQRSYGDTTLSFYA